MFWFESELLRFMWRFWACEIFGEIYLIFFDESNI